jgi:hypothetical protein
LCFSGRGWGRGRGSYRLLGRMFRSTGYNLGVLFNNLEHTIGALMNVNRCRDFIYKLRLGSLFGDWFGHRETILFLKRVIVSFTK